MAVKINCATLQGVHAQMVEVEVEVAQGLPSTLVVGLVDTSIRESKERIRAALKNSAFHYPIARIIINLAPANIFKYGTQFDLAIAMAILSASGQIEFDFKSVSFFGELSLEGALRPVNGIISFVLASRDAGLKRIFLPRLNLGEASLVNNIEIIGIDSIQEALQIINGEVSYEKKDYKIIEYAPPPVGLMENIYGQGFAKRGMEIAAAGGHNMLMKGAPGVGKTLLAEAFASIVPALTQEQLLETVQIYSAAGFLNNQISLKPFRRPNRSITLNSFVGGGRIPKPGEISLSHNGILFMDEFAEYPRVILESLREPLERGIIKISRMQGHCEFPAKFILIAAQNPCPCGFYKTGKNCICSAGQINLYQRKISGPILDRIDIQIHVEKTDLSKSLFDKFESSEDMLVRVSAVRALQEVRAGKLNSELNSQEISKYCACAKEQKLFLELANRKYDFSVRTIHRLLRVARTIADLSKQEEIQTDHIAEAIRYRLL
ncbi:MAG: YifB family Mg chelatase-like AAA ATPase [Candidatus Doudnabacteria bacterium]